MRAQKNAVIIFLMFIASVFYVSCEIITPETPPYIISKPESKIGVLEGYNQFAGVEFNFYNTSDKDISVIDISCMVYDAVTKDNPLIGSNNIMTSFNGVVLGKSSIRMIISLDEYLYIPPNEPYLIDFFYISKISYSDGSTWEDTNGTYFTRSY